MKIIKYVHSCLLVEEADKTILIDPGVYTLQEGALDIVRLNRLDYILITHEHIDHLSVPLIKQIKAKFPAVQIISNQGVAAVLKKENIETSTRGNDFIRLTPVPHEALLPGMQMPANTLFTLLGKLSHPGDSLHFAKTAEVLALPVQAPWGSMVQAAQKALEAKPRVIIPIHDWHWRDEARQWMYQMLTKFFEEQGIEFKGVETGEAVGI